MSTATFADAQRLAAQCGMYLDRNKNRGPQYLIGRREKTLHAANTIEDIIGWIEAWQRYAK